MQRVFVKEQRLLGGMQLMLRFLNALLRTNCHFGCSIWQARPSRLCRDQQSQTSNQHMTTPITSNTSSTYFLPRIYYLPPTGSPLSEWEAHAKRCAALGFDHVLKPLPEQEEGLRAIARVCAKQKLRLLLDLDIGGGALQDRLANNHPEWFAYHDPDDDLPDPRRPAALGPSMRTLRYDDAAITASVADYWVAKVRSWITAGAAGFRCLNVAQSPSSLWRTLIEAGKSTDSSARFLAWTPGSAAEELDALAGCGFDATFSSAARWDFRSPWLAEEQARLQRTAPPIAFPDSPDDTVLARMGGYDEAHTRRLLYRRALRLAAAIGNGWLIPMGFEFGLSDALQAARRIPGARTDADWLRENAVFDLSDEIRQANDFIAQAGATFHAGRLRVLNRSDAGTAVLLRHAPVENGAARDALLIVTNASVSRSCSVEESQLLERADGYVRHERIWGGVQAGAQTEVQDKAQDEAGCRHALELDAADLQLFTARRMPPIALPAAEDAPTVAAAARAPRIAIEAIAPSVDNGRFPVKRVLGDSLLVEADVFTDGHDKLAVALLWRTADEKEWRELRMHHVENDRWCASLPLTRIGRYQFAVEAWRDVFASYCDELDKKTAAGLNVVVELEEGRLLVEAAARYADRKDISAAAALKALSKMLKGAAARGSKAVQTTTVSDSERIAALLSEPIAEAMRQADARSFAVRTALPTCVRR